MPQTRACSPRTGWRPSPTACSPSPSRSWSSRSDPPTLAEGESLAHGLWEQWPNYLGYLLSFLVLGVMWLNHHRIFEPAKRVDGIVLVLNLNLLLWAVLIPFPTAVVADFLRDGGQRRRDRRRALRRRDPPRCHLLHGPLRGDHPDRASSTSSRRPRWYGPPDALRPRRGRVRRRLRPLVALTGTGARGARVHGGVLPHRAVVPSQQAVAALSSRHVSRCRGAGDRRGRAPSGPPAIATSATSGRTSRSVAGYCGTCWNGEMSSTQVGRSRSWPNIPITKQMPRNAHGNALARGARPINAIVSPTRSHTAGANVERADDRLPDRVDVAGDRRSGSPPKRQSDEEQDDERAAERDCEVARREPHPRDGCREDLFGVGRRLLAADAQRGLDREAPR